MSFHSVLDAEFGESRSTDDLEVLDGGNLPQFTRSWYPSIPSIPKYQRIARDRRVGSDVRQKTQDVGYTPYQDYLGLQELVYNENRRRSELSPSSDISFSSSEEHEVVPGPTDNLGLVRLAEVTSRFDILDQERIGALSEFSRNGTTYELDEYDIIQQKVRGQEPPTREIPVVPNDRIKEYLWHKQCKNAQLNESHFQIQGGKKKSKMICVFCKNNKEPQHVYTGHVLKDNRGFTVCPILRKYPCPICQAIGDHAHTIKYCPFNNDSEFRTSPSPLRTSRMATGKKRRS